MTYTVLSGTLNSTIPYHTITTIQKLQLVQNNIAHTVLQATRRSHAKTLLRELHWLSI